MDKGAYYIRFGSLAHRILLIAKDNKYIYQSMLVEELELGTAWISKTLQGLTARKFLYKVGRDRTPDGVSYCLWSLTPGWKYPAGQCLTNAEKCRRWRKKKKLKVPSVFDFRGRIEL
jgi:hypothetical protein